MGKDSKNVGICRDVKTHFVKVYKGCNAPLYPPKSTDRTSQKMAFMSKTKKTLRLCQLSDKELTSMGGVRVTEQATRTCRRVMTSPALRLSEWLSHCQYELLVCGKHMDCKSKGQVQPLHNSKPSPPIGVVKKWRECSQDETHYTSVNLGNRWARTTQSDIIKA